MAVKLVCKRCGNAFQVPKIRANTAKFCSNVCRRGPGEFHGPHTYSTAFAVLRELLQSNGQTTIELAARIGKPVKIINTCCNAHVGTFLRKALDEHPEHKCAGVNRFWITDLGREVMRKKLGKLEHNANLDEEE